MTDVQNTGKNRLIKTFAVFGFAAIIVFLVWLAIQLVSLLPGAFASLASMAESIQNRERTTDTIVIDAPGSVANSQESFTISWNETKRSGHYTLSYKCVDGVSLDIRLASGTILPIDCGSPYQLPEGTTSINMAFASEKERFVDVPYTIAFVPAGKTVASLESSKSLTLVNPTIPAAGLVASAEDTNEDSAPVVDTPVPTTSTPSTPAPAPREPQYVVTTTYKVPVSDPNGYTDLAVSYLGIGTITSGGKYTPTGVLDADDNAAFQFKVKNVGTKTSTTWKFEADLPSGYTYVSETQAALKPNEEAVMTIAFGEIGDDGLKKFGVRVTGGADTKTTNNSFISAVQVKD
ncbi:hypothetical protein KC722_03255 [Candidatus Kaiserbacteria bacterium]|nr:hypothetical protein [Candidatus Kaiserbacteria bacterium]MCB9811739.1 hypothetical protein [Candidatus Nomurabacteria bacterium]